VVCIDEKPVVLHEDTRTPSHAAWTSCRRDYEYKRCGTANVFCGVEPKADGTSQGDGDPLLSEFADYLLKIAVRYPQPTPSTCHGQPLHAYAEGAGGTFGDTAGLVVGPIHDPLHPNMEVG